MFALILPLIFLPLLASPTTDPPMTTQDYIQYIPLDKLKGEPMPEFGPMATNVTVQREDTTFLHCPVQRPIDRAVSYPLISWVRMRDWHILTNGLVRFTTDDRFDVLYTEGSYDWILQIKYTQEQDAGIYECQVSTSTGSIQQQVTLTVIYPEAYIHGGEEYHVDAGSPVALTCVIESSPSQPQYVFWYHNDRMVNYDTERGVTVATKSVDGRTESRLSFSNAADTDRGNYSCSPSNSAPATVQLFVTNKNSVNADPVKGQNGSVGQHHIPHALLIFLMMVSVLSVEFH